jgi:hypothetical protein
MFIGTLCAISGVLAMALPIPIVVNNFAQFYNNNKLKQKQIARKREKVTFCISYVTYVIFCTKLPGDIS